MLECAVRSGNTSCVTELLTRRNSAGESVSTETKTHALSSTFKLPWSAETKQIIEILAQAGAELDEAFSYAALNRRVEAIRLLHDLGARDDPWQEHHVSALERAIDGYGSDFSYYEEIPELSKTVELLLQLGADPNGHSEPPGSERTLQSLPIYIAMANQHYNVVKMLQEAGADLSLYTQSSSAVEDAAQRHDLFALEFLIAHGRRATSKALVLAVDMTGRGYPYDNDNPHRLAIIDFLLNNGASPDDRVPFDDAAWCRGKSLIEISYKWNSLDRTTRLLLDETLCRLDDPSPRSGDWRRLLVKAVQIGHLEMVDRMLDTIQPCWSPVPELGR